MKIKNKTQQKLLFIALMVLISVIVYQIRNPIIIKKSHSGQGNMFENIDGVHYVHTQRDTNNRIIPEAFFYGKTVTIEDLHPEIDSIKLRYEDILANGLKNYTLTEDDIIIQAMIGNN